MKQPKVSLITTVYNGEKHLPQAIESVLSQTTPNWEWIIWDDGSTDQTRSILEQAAETDSRIRLVFDTHKGRVPSLVSAMTMARGEYLGWLDADDELEPDCLKFTARFLEARQDVDLVYTHYRDMSADGTRFELGKRTRIKFSADRLLTNFMVFHFRLFRREVLEGLGDLSTLEPYAEDYDFVLRVAEKCQIKYFPLPLYKYRRHDQQTSKRHRLQQIDASRKAIEKALTRRGLDDKLRVRLDLQPRFSLVKRKESI